MVLGPNIVQKCGLEAVAMILCALEVNRQGTAKTFLRLSL